MNEKEQISIIDLLSVMSFYIGLINLEMNITQNDIAEQTTEIDQKVNEHLHNVLTEIHSHLQSQDKKLIEIEKRLEELQHDDRTDFF